MPEQIRKRSKKVGLPPGTLVHIGEKRITRTQIRLTQYNEWEYREHEVKNIEECFPFKDKPTVNWISIYGLHQVGIIEKLGKYLDLHPLILEDVVNTDQRPKMEDFGRYIFIILKMFKYNEEKKETEAEQVSLIFGQNFVISLQETEGDIFHHVRKRIEHAEGKMRKNGTDYLAYSLMDAIIDYYFVIMEKLGEIIEDVEDELVTNAATETLHSIHKLKQEMIFLRKSIWPLRSVINNLERIESPLIQQTTSIYLTDVYDHTIQIIDNIETFRETLSNMLEIYLSSISHKMNEIMKVLTIIATIFIPLTFIAGIYGMNFKYFPELEWQWGYFAVLIVMAITGISMVAYFKKKKWL